MRRALITKAGIMLVIVTLAYGANFGLNIILARLLSMQAYGNFSVIKEVLMLTSLLLLQGSDLAALKFVPEYVTKKEWSLLKGYLSHNLANFARVTLIVLAFVVIIGVTPYVSFGLMLIVGLLALLFAQSNYVAFVLRGLQRIFLSALIFDLGVPLLFGIACGFLLLAYQHSTLNLVLDWYAVILVVLISLGCWFLWSTIARYVLDTKSTRQQKFWNKTSWQLMLSKFVLTLLFSSEIILLKLFGHNADDVGIFGAILTIGSLYWLIFNAVTYVLSPLISPHAKDKAKLKAMFKSSTVILLVLVVMLSIVLIIFRTPMLNHFGPNYVKGSLALIIVMVGFAFTVVLGLPWYFIGLTGQQHRLVMPVTIVAILSIIVTSLLAHFFNLLGAAIGLALTDIAMAIWLTMLMYAWVV
ncbi:MAG: hypothetical protein KAT71_00465 [Gammaproteobacteria bacterium]|nr:hypothetical protein [Gammaproteobacteria bacterium]